MSAAMAPDLPTESASLDLTPRWKSLNRWQAFAIHLALSVLVFMALVALMVFIWFPGDLFLLDGGWQGLKLVAIIDLVLGPALTLILWNTKKSSLVFDMCIVALFQIAALAYGFVTTYDQRTVALVFSDRAFNSVSNADLVEGDAMLVEKEGTPVSLSDFELGSPTLVIAQPPTKDSFGQYLADVMNGYPDAVTRSDQFISISDGREAMQKWALDDETLTSLGWKEQLEEAVSEEQLNADNLELYRFETRYATGVVLFDADDLAILDYIPMNTPSKPVVTTAESALDE